MKKLICVFAAVVMLAVIPFTGCGNDHSDEINATVDDFMTSMQKADLDGMKEYADPALFEDDGMLSQFNELEEMDEELASSLGMSTSDLSDKTKTIIDKYVKDMMGKMIKSYEIGEITEEKDSAKVNLSVTFGFDPNKVDSVDVTDEVEKRTNDYMEDNMTELTQVYQSGGQTALMNKVLDDLAEELLQTYEDAVLKTGETTEDTVLTVENRDGKWVIVSEE